MSEISNNRDKTKYFFEMSKKMMPNSKMNEDSQITPDNIYQPAYKENRDILLKVMKEGHLPGSCLMGKNNLLDLYNLAQQGHSCIILSEHVSNLDVPSMFTRFYDDEDEIFKEIFEHLIFIAGVKLNQTPLVKLYTEMFSRVVIYPIRSMEKKKNDPSFKEELDLAKKINLRATRKIGELRKQGFIFVMYPAGTRYRPWDENTGKGLNAAASYLNSFEYFLCSSINGNNMPPEKHEDMVKEKFLEDVIVFNFGKIHKTQEYINKINGQTITKNKDEKDKMKQLIVSNIMQEIKELHNEAEK